MIQTIRLDHLLREAVATPYRNLVTRPTGAAVRGRIEAALASSPCLTAMLDFSEVGLLDFSCADEIVAKLLLRAEPHVERYVVLRGLHEEQREAVEHVLLHHRLAVTVLPEDDGPGLLGWVTDDARVAFRYICERGPIDAARLAGLLEWPAQRADEALRSLALHRLVRPAGDAYHPLPLA
jgi:hypothetical protein